MRLVTPDVALLDAALEGDGALALALGCEVAEGWSGVPIALKRTRDEAAARSGTAHWGTRFFVEGDPGTMVGWGGFKGTPRGGVVEIGYEIAPAFRGRGLAGDAARALLEEAWTDPQVTAVIAHTLAEPGPSTRVLEKLGFRLDDAVVEEQVGNAWRFRLGR